GLPTTILNFSNATRAIPRCISKKWAASGRCAWAFTTAPWPLKKGATSFGSGSGITANTTKSSVDGGETNSSGFMQQAARKQRISANPFAKSALAGIEAVRALGEQALL